MPYCPCGNEFSEARARLGFDCCLECGKNEAAAEIARRARMIAPISHKSGYTYLGPDEETQRQRLLEGSAKTPRMETGTRVIGRTAQPKHAGAMNWPVGNSSPTSGEYAESERYFENCPASNTNRRKFPDTSVPSM
jgi:hypothetical protein